uniref:SFRICE_022039 n=1 Tax=Spodoptera frugiperda TaxID=7108 RepID=A0A2H1V8J9_SPOFR
MTMSRNVGRPSTRWTYDIVRVAGSQWMQVAACCSTWRTKGEAFVQQWTSLGSTGISVSQKTWDEQIWRHVSKLTLTYDNV